MRPMTEWAPASVVLLATVLALVFAPGLVRRVEYAQVSARVSLARQTLQDDDILVRMDQAVRRVSESVEPGVVHIDVRQSGMSPFASSSGSGWLFDGQGHVVTNAHVIRGASRIRIQLSDGRVFEGKLVGADPFTDIAVLQLPTTEGLFPVVRATGYHPHQGDRVFAFGSPFGFKFSMSEGIISGMGREPAGAVALANGYTNFIQTDAAVNPGNSGGPLVNVRGQLIGMNVAIATGNDSQGTLEGQSAGISFAIPIKVIESVVTQLLEHGTVKRGFLGISLPRTNNQVRDTGYNGFGVLVPAVSKDGPADRAGLKPGDVITQIDGEPVTGVGVLRSLISTVKPGQPIILSLWRDGEEIKATAVLDEATPEVVLNGGVLRELARFGMQLNNSRGIGQDPPVVTRVLNGSAAENAGFVPGQHIVSVNDTKVQTLDECTSAMAAQGMLIGKRIEVHVVQEETEDGQPREETHTIRIEQ